MILDGVLPPGDWIAEMKLCNDLAISRTPLREALKVLASENLVTLLPNRGAIVTDIRVDEIVELFEIMGALEGLVGRLAVARATDDDIETLGAMHKAMVGRHDKGDRPAYFDLNQAIHQRIADLSGNQSLANAYAGFAGKIKRARYLANLSDARWAESVREHEGFMAALASRDAPLFASLLQDHSHHTGEVVCRRLREHATLSPPTYRGRRAPISPCGRRCRRSRQMRGDRAERDGFVPRQPSRPLERPQNQSSVAIG
jgi:DNA-binding GntR family transcriptional regulator